MKRALYCSLLWSVFSSLDAHAAIEKSPFLRCKEELAAVGGDTVGIQVFHQKGRHAWALRCGHLDLEDVRIAEKRGLMWSFTTEDALDFSVAPTVESAPCGNLWKPFGSCPLGCFSSSDKILFDGRWLTVPDAQAQQVHEFTGLAEQSSLAELVLAPGVEIDYYTAGPETIDLFSITTEDRKNVKVTTGHPLVLDDGVVVPASYVKVGDRLLTLDGPKKVCEIRPYKELEQVWNFRPESDHALHNVAFAGGILTGTTRFQNEWADLACRNLIRKKLSVSLVNCF